jgi:PadR family transcriptional regulator PadR
MERFMEVCLLFLLSQKIGHGYALAEQLPQFGFEPEQVSVSTLYRSLRNLEKIGAAISDWEAGAQGPKRRIYHLTERGNELLQEWIETLKQRRTRLDQLIQTYDASTNPPVI